jgi:uncharacterized membrane protein HdeD (DUF308 family)
MMLARGGVALLVSAVASNQPEISATSLVFVFGLWALAEGVATLRQASPPSGTSIQAVAQPLMLAMGSIAVLVGLLCVMVPGLASGTVTWMLAVWFAVRAAFEAFGAFAGRGKARVLLGAAAMVDLGLVALFVTHTSGSVVNLALFGGALTLVWGLVYLALGLTTSKVKDWAPEGPRLLSRR